MKTATRTFKQNVEAGLSDLDCEVHFYLMADGRCSCPVRMKPKAADAPKVAQPGPVLVRPKQRYTIMSDEDCNYYYIPTDKEQAFEAWVAATVNGELEDYYEKEGEDFTEYGVDGALTRLTFENPEVN